MIAAWRLRCHLDSPASPCAFLPVCVRVAMQLRRFRFKRRLVFWRVGCPPPQCRPCLRRSAFSLVCALPSSRLSFSLATCLLVINRCAGQAAEGLPIPLMPVVFAAPAAVAAPLFLPHAVVFAPAVVFAHTVGLNTLTSLSIPSIPHPLLSSGGGSSSGYTSGGSSGGRSVT